MKKLLLIGLCLLAFSCTKKVGDNGLQSFVKKNLNDKKGVFKLSAYNDVQWDKVYILGPYTNKKMYDATLKPYNMDIVESQVTTDDQISFLMLFKGNKLVSQAVFSRDKYDFSNLTLFTNNAKLKAYPRDSANFHYSKPKWGYVFTTR